MMRKLSESRLISLLKLVGLESEVLKINHEFETLKPGEGVRFGTRKREGIFRKIGAFGRYDIMKVNGGIRFVIEIEKMFHFKDNPKEFAFEKWDVVKVLWFNQGNAGSIGRRSIFMNNKLSEEELLGLLKILNLEKDINRAKLDVEDMVDAGSYGYVNYDRRKKGKYKKIGVDAKYTISKKSEGVLCNISIEKIMQKADDSSDRTIISWDVSGLLYF